MKKLKEIIKGVSTIGIVAPASSNERSIMEENIDKFKSLGYNIKLSENLYNINKYLSATDKERAYDLNCMFKDKSIDAIVCYRGGYGSIRMAKYLDLKVIKNNPKIFCGYSDITLLLNYISYKCNFPTFHGPMVNSNFEDNTTKEYFEAILENKFPTIKYDISKITNNNYEVFNRKSFAGRLVGGNLSLICSTLSTPYEIRFKNNILLIEEVGEKPYAIDRMISKLIESNKLKELSGIILGDFTDCDGDENSFSVDDLIKEKLVSLKIPIIKSLPFGHNYPNIIIPIGSQFKFDSSKNILYQNQSIFT